MMVFIMDLVAGYNFVIGQKTMYELEGGPHFGNLAFHFLMRSIPLKSTDDVCIKPNQSKTHILQMLSLPPQFKGRTAIVKLRSKNPGALPQTLKLDFDKKGRAYVTVNNTSSNIWNVYQGETMGSVDMGSLGYFHINRDVLENTLEDTCQFLSEDDTCEFFHKLIEDHNEVCEVINTRLTNRDEEEKKIRDSNSTKEDPYPWLDADNPRRMLTDYEIIRKYVNLEESDLTLKEKKTLIQVIMNYKKAFSL